VIAGGGCDIAAELGHFFETFGSDVAIIGRRPQLLRRPTRRSVRAFTERYADRFDLYTG